jgi:hypothetical protein
MHEIQRVADESTGGPEDGQTAMAVLRIADRSSVEF